MEIGAEIGLNRASEYGSGVVAKETIPDEYYWICQRFGLTRRIQFGEFDCFHRYYFSNPEARNFFRKKLTKVHFC